MGSPRILEFKLDTQSQPDLSVSRLARYASAAVVARVRDVLWVRLVTDILHIWPIHALLLAVLAPLCCQVHSHILNTERDAQSLPKPLRKQIGCLCFSGFGGACGGCPWGRACLRQTAHPTRPSSSAPHPVPLCCQLHQHTRQHHTWTQWLDTQGLCWMLCAG